MKKDQKKDFVEKLKEQIEQAKSIFLADYRGLTTLQLSQLRNLISDQDAELKITKNTLLKRALESTNYELPTPNLLEGPTATLFSFKEEISPLKTLFNFLRSAGIGQLKGGFLKGKFLSSDELQKLALLPDRQTLVASLIRTLSSPLYGTINILQANLRNLVFVLSEAQKKKS